ncbi:glycosyltransferase [Micromonospora sp. NPDC049114]|uniref:glycosyltransferase n=1 Tax=Micromonospora sp. NPDC049114 TaxID=3155498 RepID=UPI0033EC0E23
MTDKHSPRVLLLGFTVGDDVFREVVARDVVLPTQTHTFAWSLVRSLRAAGCPVRLLSAAPASTFPRNRQIRFRSGHFQQDGVPGELLGFVNLLGLKHLTRFVAAVRAGSRTLRRHGDDILLIHGVHTPFLWFGVLVAWRGSARVVPVLTDPPGVVLPDDGRIVRALRRLDHALVRMALRRSSGVVVLTAALGEDFAPSIPRLVMEGICDPPTTGASTGGPDAGPPSDAATRDIVYAGGLTRAYGVDRLIEAFRGMPDPDLRLLLFGRGELEDWSRTQAEVDPRISPPELLDRAALVRRLASASVLVNPRPVEQSFVRYSFPSKLIEYLSTGVPVVTTRLPGIPPDYEPYLRFAETDTADGLREALLRLLATPPGERAALGAAGAAFVRESRGPAAQGRRIRSFLAGLPVAPSGGVDAVEQGSGSPLHPLGRP